MTNKSNFKTFIAGLILENPVLVLVLGTCPTLAQTKSVVNAITMGLAATVVLICSNLVISLLRKVIPDVVRIPCYIVVIAAFVTLVDMLMHAFLPPLYEMLGVYLALIVVNCIILGRAEMFASKNGVWKSTLDGAGMGLGFLLALLAMALIREVLGAGTITLFNNFVITIPLISNYTIPILVAPPGGFLVFGLLIAVVNAIGVKKGAAKRNKEYSCAGCPSASLCGKTSCSEMQEVITEIEDSKEEKEAEE